MTFTTEEFFEVAIESWPEWDLSPQPLIKSKTTKILKCIKTLLKVYT